MTIEEIRAEMNRILNEKRMAEDQKTRYYLLSTKINKVNSSLASVKNNFLSANYNIGNGGFVVSGKPLAKDKITEFINTITNTIQENKIVLSEINQKLTALTTKINSLTSRYNTLNVQYQSML